jgi:3-oxoadipate enol-lactonase
MPQIEANGGTICYSTRGRADAPWVTLSHSISGDKTMWDETAKALARYFRVLQYDVRGHGGSVHGSQQIALEDLADDVVRLWDALGIEMSHFIGVSLGGMVGIDLALRYAERVDRLVLSDTRVNPTPQWTEMFYLREQSVRQHGMSSIVNETLAIWFTPAFAPAHADTVEQLAAVIENTSPEGYLRCLAAVVARTGPIDLARIQAPTLAIVGAEDRGTPPALMKSIAESIPNAKYLLIPKAAHIPNMEQPEAFESAVIPFLQQAR